MSRKPLVKKIQKIGSSRSAENFEGDNDAKLLDGDHEEYGTTNPRGIILVEGSQRRSCCGMICVLLNAVNQMGLTPLMYHTDKQLESYTDQKGTYHSRRAQHYKATFAWMSLALLAIAIPFYATNFKHIQDDEHHFYNGLDHVGHQAAAVIFMFGASLVAGVLAYGIHKLYDCLASRKRDDYGYQPVSQTALLNQDDDQHLSEHGSIVKLGNCPTVDWTPFKTFVTVTLIGMVAFTIASLVKNHHFFDVLSGSSPLANGTFTNCTMGNATGANSTACLQEWAHIGSVGTLGIFTAFLGGAAATAVHAVGAKIHDKIEERRVSDYSRL